MSTNPNVMRHSSYINALLLSITKHKLPVRLYRRHVGLFIPAAAVYAKNFSKVSIGIAGQADLTGSLLFKDRPAQTVEIEVKSNPSDKLRPAQINWRDHCQASNIHWYESRDIDKTIHWLKSLFI